VVNISREGIISQKKAGLARLLNFVNAEEDNRLHEEYPSGALRAEDKKSVVG
jgi:hypothetical protein